MPNFHFSKITFTTTKKPTSALILLTLMLVSPSRNLTFQLFTENSVTFWQADGLNKLGLDSTTLAVLLQLNQSCRTENTEGRNQKLYFGPKIINKVGR
ncbi:hypothetical protein Nmel_007391 [Mimus melanotis]